MSGTARGKNKGRFSLPEKEDTIAIPGHGLSDPCRKMLSKLSTAVCIRDKDSRPLYANPAYLQLFDTTLEAWMGSDDLRQFGTETADFLAREVAPAVMAGKVWKGELEIITGSGATKRVLAEFSGIHDEAGGATHYYAMYTDTTLVRHLERALQNQVDMLNSILDALPDPLFVKNSDHAWIVVNEAFCKLTGRTRHEILGNTDHDFFPKAQADIFWGQDDKAMATGKEIANEEEITGRDGNTRRLFTRKRAFTGGGGDKIVVGTARDITDQRNLEQAMAKSYDQLEKALASLRGGLGQFQRGVAAEAAKADAIQGLIGRSNEFFRNFLEQTGAPPAPPAPASRDRAHLSPREYQVTLLLAKGHRIKDVAEHLRLSPNTVSTYRARIMRKLELCSNTDLIQYALRNGLL